MRKLNNWLDSFCKYLEDTESPTNYIFWSGISVLSSSLKRNIYVPKFPYKIFPNEYIILVGPPGVGKGTAINPATSLAKGADTVNYLSDRITAEKIVDQLAVGFQKVGITNLGNTVGGSGGVGQVTFSLDKTATIVSTELPVFLSASEWMLPLLCDLWDRNEFHYSTKGKGSKTIDDLCVGLLAGCVPDYIRKLNRDATASITGGFTSRCIFVFASEKSKVITWPATQVGTQLEQDLKDDLIHIQAKLKGEMQLSKDARNFSDLYNRAIKIDRFDSEVITNFKARQFVHVIKLAMAFSVSESDSMIIEQKHIEKAIPIIDDILDTLDITFRNVGESPLLVQTERVMDYVESVGAASREEILRRNIRYMTMEELDRVLLTAITTGFLVRDYQAGTTLYKDTGVRNNGHSRNGFKRP